MQRHRLRTCAREAMPAACSNGGYSSKCSDRRAAMRRIKCCAALPCCQGFMLPGRHKGTLLISFGLPDVQKLLVCRL